jgi:hypothetical protein
MVVCKALAGSVLNIINLKVRKTYFKLNSFAEIYEKEEREVVCVGASSD